MRDVALGALFLGTGIVLDVDGDADVRRLAVAERDPAGELGDVLDMRLVP